MTFEMFQTGCGYEVEGVWLPRVTDITTVYPRPQILRYYAEFPNFMAAQKTLAQMADWGVRIHQAVQEELRGARPEPDAVLEPSLAAFRQWRSAVRIELPSGGNDIEARVFDLENAYAGTVDVLARVNGRLGIMDIKTGSAVHEEYGLQTAAYLNAYNSRAPEGAKAETRWILRIDQYQECLGCGAKRRTKGGRARVAGGHRHCCHQWSPEKGAVEFKELSGQERDLEGFLAVKDLWEWYHRKWLRKIPHYPKNLLPL